MTRSSSRIQSVEARKLIAAFSRPNESRDINRGTSPFAMCVFNFRWRFSDLLAISVGGATLQTQVHCIGRPCPFPGREFILSPCSRPRDAGSTGSTTAGHPKILIRHCLKVLAAICHLNHDHSISANWLCSLESLRKPARLGRRPLDNICTANHLHPPVNNSIRQEGFLIRPHLLVLGLDWADLRIRPLPRLDVCHSQQS